MELGLYRDPALRWSTLLDFPTDGRKKKAHHRRVFFIIADDVSMSGQQRP
jgi:hypothetical protein